MAKPQSVRDQVRSLIPSRVHLRWESHLPADVRTELDELRRDFLAGKLGPGVSKTGLAKAIYKTMQARGLPGSMHTVARWLDR